jgi:acyl dehydratase
MANDEASSIPMLVRGLTWEEMEIGVPGRTASRTITETDLVNFITLFGFNEPLFWDAGHAASAGFERGRRLVPGALTYCVAEGLVIQTHLIYGTGMAFVHMELDVKRPVFVGDTIYAVVETTEARQASTGSRGVVTATVSVRNHRDEEVLVYKPVRIIRGKAG